MGHLPIPELQPLSPNPNTPHLLIPKSKTEPTLHRRYNIVSIPATYGRQNSSPAPGTVAGIVLGSVAGFLLLLYLIYFGLNAGRNRSSATSVSDIVIGRSRSRSQSHGRRHHGPDVIEVEEEHRRPPRSGWRRGRDHRDDEIVVEESVESRSRSDDVIEVEEESESSVAPPRRSRRSGSYRTVDPLAYGGGSRY